MQIIGLFPELLRVGGVQEASRLSAAAIMALAPSRGWSVEFFSLNDPPGPHTLGVGGHTVEFRGYGRRKARFVLAAFGAARSAPSGTTGAILATHPNLALPASWVRCNSRKWKTTVMSHGIEVWKPLPMVKRRALSKAHAVLGPSTYTVRKLVEVQNIAPDTVRRLSWPISPWFLRIADAPARLILPANFPAAPVILTVGRWVASERYKGADDLIRAVAQLRLEFPALNLVAVGSGDDLPRLRKLVNDLGVGDRVTFFENLSREELAACYSHSDIFALPSAGEGFGLVFLEAMAFSRPVVAASSGGATDVVEDDVNGLVVPPQNIEQLAVSLSRLLRDAPLRDRLGQRGGALVRQKYRFEVFQRELAEILES